MFNYYSSPGLSSTLLAHALLLKSATASSSSGSLGLSRRRPLHAWTPSTTTSRTSSILPFLKKHARQHDDCDDTTSCADTVYTSSTSGSSASAPPPVNDDDPQNPAGKRQRRQAAATLVQNLPSWTGVGKKSKAQPRPAVLIPPKGIGPIAEPNQNDVLCGRGGRINSHEGNVQFRELVNSTKKEYLAKSTKKLEKAHIAAGVVQQIRNMDPPGRFLKEEADTGMWWDIGDQKAIKKVGQALREDAPDIRDELDDDVDDKKTPDKATSKKPPLKPAPKDEKSVASGGSKNVIVLPTTRSNKRGEDNSPGALPPQSSLKQPQQLAHVNVPQPSNYQQVLPPGSGASITQVSLPSMGPPQAGMMYPPSSQGSNSSATLRHGQFSLRGQGTMSQKAMEMMQQQQMQNGNRMMAQNANNQGIFGRRFVPPSEMSLGSHGSSVSGLSGFTNSQLMDAQTLLSGVSDGVSSLTAGDNSYRMALAAAAANGLSPADAQQLALLHQQQAMNNMNSNNSGMGPPNVGMFQNQLNMGSGNSAYSGSRGSNGFNNNFNTTGSNIGSDLSGQTMPQAAGIFGRTSSHNDVSNLLVRDDMSLAEHSLMGGGIRGQLGQLQQQQMQQLLLQQQQAQMQQQQQAQQQAQQQQQLQQQQQQQQHQAQQQQQHQAQQQQQLQQRQQQQEEEQAASQSRHDDGMDASFMSGLSGFGSLQSKTRGSYKDNYKDGMDFSVFSGASLANSLANTRPPTSARDPYHRASSRYGSSGVSVSGRSYASNYSISAMSQSIASLSLHDGASVASFSAQSAMSDFSDTLLALDLAETSSRAL